MERFQGLIGIIVILGIAFLFSNNKKRIKVILMGHHNLKYIHLQK